MKITVKVSELQNGDVIQIGGKPRQVCAVFKMDTGLNKWHVFFELNDHMLIKDSDLEIERGV